MGKGLNTVLGSTHVVEQLSFSMFPSILTFDFDFILGPQWTFLGLGKGSNTVFGSTHVVEQLSFCMLINPKSESKSDLGFSLETHFPTHPPPGESR